MIPPPRFFRLFTLLCAGLTSALCAVEPQTESQYLSGHGPKDAVPWEFTVTGEHAAVDARADGSFAADVTLGSVRDATSVDAQIFSADGKPVGDVFSTAVPAGGAGHLHLSTQVNSPRTWTSETPNLYSVRLALRKGKEVLHTTTERFGFRTFEVRPGQGLYLNGQRILLKGVDRHSFRAETARTLSREDCYDEVRLIRSMNMNAVRMSHYPPDEAFLEACDELGL